MKARRTVTVRAQGRGAHWVRLWAYGHADLADLFGISEGAVRQAVYEKRFDPSDLRSIVNYLLERKVRRPVHAQRTGWSADSVTHTQASASGGIPAAADAGARGRS